MIDAHLALQHAERRLTERLQQLEKRLDVGDEAAWPAYCEAVSALVAVVPQTVPGAGRAMTTRQLADAFGIDPKTARRKGLAGQLPVTPIRLGQRGRSALRWGPA